MTRIGLLAVGLALGLPAISQVVVMPGPPDTTDFQGWFSATLDWKPADGLKVELQEQWRIKHDWGAYDRQIHQLGVSWSPEWNGVSDAQHLGAAARVTTRLDDTGENRGIERFFRWHVEHGAEVELGRWAIGSRLRYQKRTALWLKDGDDPSGLEAKETWRFKGTLSYNIKNWKLDPKIAVERFCRVVPDEWPSDGAWRARIGTDFKPGKRQRIKVMLQREWKGKYTPTGLTTSLDDFRLFGDNQWALLIGYRYRMKTQRKKD